MVSPSECAAKYEKDVLIRTARCFFCQREQDSISSNSILQYTHIWWMGKQVHTSVCVRCMDFLRIPKDDLSTICDFCGYPGGNIQPYMWDGDHAELSSISPALHGVRLNTFVIKLPETCYMCCEQCMEFFARNPLEE